MTLVQEINITINDNYRVVHNQTQHHNQGRQGNRIQLYTKQIHKTKRHSGTNGDTGTGHQCRTQRKHHDHHHDNHDDGNQQIAQERQD